MCVYLGMRLEKGQFSGADFVLLPGWGRVSLTVSANLYTPGYPSHQFPGDSLWHASLIEVLRLQMWGTKSGLLHIPGLKLTWSGRFVWNVLSPWTLTGPSVDFNLLLGGGDLSRNSKASILHVGSLTQPSDLPWELSNLFEILTGMSLWVAWSTEVSSAKK